MILASRWGAEFYYEDESGAWRHKGYLATVQDAQDAMIRITESTSWRGYNVRCERKPDEIRAILHNL